MQYEENDSVSFGKLEQQNTGKNDLEINRLFPPPPPHLPLPPAPLPPQHHQGCKKKGSVAKFPEPAFYFRRKSLFK